MVLAFLRPGLAGHLCFLMRGCWILIPFLLFSRVTPLFCKILLSLNIQVIGFSEMVSLSKDHPLLVTVKSKGTKLAGQIPGDASGLSS